MHAISAADERNEIPRLKSILAHMILDRLYGVGQIKRIMLTLPRLHQRNKYIKTITLAGVALGGHQAFDFLERSAVITLGFDRHDIHNCPHTVSASIASYSRCVPMNRM